MWIAAISIVLALCAVLLFLNFATSEKRIERQLERHYATDDPQFARAMSALLGPPIVDGNRVEVLLNGDQIFPAMLDAIHGAEHTITFETYIYWSESVGQRFAQALSGRAKAGVKVHVLLDWAGSAKMEQRYLDELTQAGVEIER